MIVPRKILALSTPYLVGRWIVGVASKRGPQMAYLHPCGDVLLYPASGESPMHDRYLIGTYTSGACPDAIGEDIEAMEVVA